MLTGSKELLEQAQNQGYAIGHFNTFDLEITKAIVAAANIKNSPVIIGTSEKAISYAGLEELAEIVKIEASKVSVPIVLHLDHGKSFEICQKAIQMEYTSLMIDGSNLNYEDNVRLTQRVVKMAHRKGIPVEGELGALVDKEKYQNSASQFMTDPDQARKFVQETQIDNLAISIGNAHGIPLPEEKLDFNRLAQIKKVVSIPLVLHGASSTPTQDIKKAISLGITKINIDTDIRIAFNQNIKEFISAHKEVIDPREILGSASKAIQKVVEEKIELFGSSNRLK